MTPFLYMNAWNYKKKELNDIMNVLPMCLGRAYASGASSERAASVLNG